MKPCTLGVIIAIGLLGFTAVGADGVQPTGLNVSSDEHINTVSPPSSNKNSAPSSSTNNNKNTKNKNTKNDKTTKGKIPPPEHQDIPKLIEKDDRTNLLGFIAANKHDKVVAFFKAHSLLDYPLIRFTKDDAKNIKAPKSSVGSTNDGSSGQSVHGLTPLAAALYYCAPETAKVLANIQMTFPWTINLGPRHSLIEIAARHCPTLLTTIIKERDTHPLGTILDAVTIHQAIQVLFDVNKSSDSHSFEDTDVVMRWIEAFFNQKLYEQYNDIFNSKRKKVSATGERTEEMDSTKSMANFNKLIETWIHSGRQTGPLIRFLKERVIFTSVPMYLRAAIMLLRANYTSEFISLLNTLTKPKHKLRTLSIALPVFSPEQFDLLDSETQTNIAKYISFIPVETQYLIFENGIQAVLNQIANFSDNLNAIAKSNPLSEPFADSISASATQKVVRKYLPTVYGSLFKKFPRLDTVVHIHQKSDLNDVGIIWTGNTLIPFEKDHLVHKMMMEALRNDDPEVIKSLLAVDKSDFDWDKQRFEDLRYSVSPYYLSPLKAAVMFEKPKLINYYLTANKSSINNLYKSTKGQLSAIKMAACYKPKLFLDHILPLVGDRCEKRYKAANHVIDMFRDTKLNLCPTKSLNAAIILPKLLTTTGKDSSVTRCIVSSDKDYIEEAFKLNSPSDFIKGLHATGLYKKNEYYLLLSVRGGNLQLFHYFFDVFNKSTATKADEKKKAEQILASSLATWIRYTDGKMNPVNMELLEFLLTHEKVDVNAVEKESGSTALSLATKRGLIWIVKRLLLHPAIDPNIPDRNSHSTALHHAINRFRNELPVDDHSGDTFIIRIIRVIAADFDIVLPELLLKQIKEKISSMDNFGFKIDLSPFKQSLADYLEKNMGFDQKFAETMSNMILSTFKVENLVMAMNRKSLIEAIPDIIEFLENAEMKIENIASLLKPFIKDKADVVAESFRIIFNIALSILEEIFETLNYLEELVGITDGAVDLTNLGLVHNLLLSHPSIDTTIENSSNADALLLCKTRTTLLKGDSDGFDEMARTHVRIRNFDAVLDGRRTWSRVIVGGVSTIIVGAASAGIIKWML